ncbi:hypothetical protein PUN50_26745 (plasmid) [Vibrio campbellii]|uniref:Uncharacterized protein n=1 Tax=Vibrio campbellii TaxID=680 RepID=A0AAQ2Y667_9VIBR|nr:MULTISPECIES: hypothetical protein [Vibrio harveyi group]MCE7732631.1 hypothetical protein [Vibrio campbellii]WDG12019.1 hypothetical protein PUN50_26745 [Vibrio campbellii]
MKALFLCGEGQAFLADDFRVGLKRLTHFLPLLSLGGGMAGRHSGHGAVTLAKGLI